MFREGHPVISLFAAYQNIDDVTNALTQCFVIINSTANAQRVLDSA